MAIGSVDVQLTRFEKGHVALRVRAGSKEPGAWGSKGVKLSLDDKEAHEVLAAIGLGHTTDSTRYGLSFAGAATVQLRTAYATLVLNPRGEARLVQSGTPELAADEDAVQLPLCLLTQGMRGRRLIDDALATHGLQVTPQLETDSVAALFAHVRTGRWASIVPQPWIHTLGVPAGVSVLRLRRPSVTALIALVTNRAEPGPLLARALRRTAREARIGATLGELP